jgi:hypothetical protein
VQDHREIVGVALGARVVGVARRELVDELRRDGEQERHLAGDLVALGDLLLAAERHEPVARVCASSAESCVTLNIGGQRREHRPAVQAAEHRDGGLDRVPAEHDTMSPGPTLPSASWFEMPIAHGAARRTSPCGRRGPARPVGMLVTRAAKSVHRSPSRQWPSA